MFHSISYNPVALIFLSYGMGVLVTELIKLIGWYDCFENHNYISDRWTKNLGVLTFGWLIRHTFMGKFNQKLVYKGKLNREKLTLLHKNMTYAENNHLMGFTLLLILNIAFLFTGHEIWYILLFFVLNVIFNLYLVFLQQYNKRRILRLLQIKR